MIAALGGAAGARGQSPIYGSLETYLGVSRSFGGIRDTLTWGEINYRAQSDLKLTASFTTYSDYSTLDELCATYDFKGVSLRAGRFRTAFGFSNWSEFMYDGCDHLPLVKTYPLSDRVPLLRDDSGVEATTTVAGVQVQAALVDTTLAHDQLTPDDTDTGTLRVQAPLGAFIVGVDALRRLREEEGIYGLDVRYTAPRVVGRAEFYDGSGPRSAAGYYVDLKYRVPKLPRTQLVGITEMLDMKEGSPPVYLHTLGVRQIVSRNLVLDLNYGFGTHLDAFPYVREQGADNFSARAMFQIQF